ncbi:GNAT family N-acetyltransferase [Gorillibacterium sp. CAU 1737]|uniref:GNAT family N-acetyltransferase n=1 Tax=Gorillibacterium sp. CAU 1737 TaxID=3140362 RepID=UPI003260BA0F
MTQVLSLHLLMPEDRDAAFRVFEEAIPAAFEEQEIGHETYAIEREIETKKELVERSLDASETSVTFLVAKRGGEVVGTISFAPCGHEIQVCTDHELDAVGELGSLYVRPNVQNQGIGSALIRELLTHLRERGIERFCLDSGYWAAQKRWRRKFGEPYKVVDDFWGPGSPHMIWLCHVDEMGG